MNIPSDTSPICDPRGKGFRSRSTVANLQALISNHVSPLTSEKCDTRDGFHRVLAQSITSEKPIPPFDRSAMDGFALKADETFGSDHYTPTIFTRVGHSRPGLAFSGIVKTGEAVAIATGAPIPDGTDAVVPVEFTEINDNQIKVRESVTPGRHIGKTGEDVMPGIQLMNQGRVLRPQDLGLLSGLGLSQISVIKKPKIAILITGNEILPAFESGSEHKIADMNSPMLISLVERDGGVPFFIGPVWDIPEILASMISELASDPKIDAIFINGGSSTGPEDYAPSILANQGQLLVHGVALRPASPTGFGLIGSTPVLLLPGNPVSCLCAYDFFGCRIVRQLSGRNPEWPYPKKQMQLAQKVSSVLGRMDYVRVQIRNGPSGEMIYPLAVGGASILSGTIRADGFIVVPDDLEGYPEGTELTVWCYDIP